jgi:hypothetical protein
MPVLSASLVGNLGQTLSKKTQMNEKSSQNSRNLMESQEHQNDQICLDFISHSLFPLYHHSSPSSPSPSILPTPIFTRVTQWGEKSTFGTSYSLITDPEIGTNQRITAAARYGVFFAGEGIDIYDTGSIHASISTAEKSIRYIIDGVEDVIDEDEDEEIWEVVGCEDQEEEEEQD